MKLLNLSPKVYQYYRNNLNGNEFDSYDQARRKMTRNMMLAEELDSTGYTAKKYCFGSLHFLVKDGTVIWIRNRCKVPSEWDLNKSEYVRLNKVLHINGKSKMDLVKRDWKYKMIFSKKNLKRKVFQLVSN